jgi:hypothetical protein
VREALRAARRGYRILKRGSAAKVTKFGSRLARIHSFRQLDAESLD